ncbi:hypothetical protein [Sphingobacterium sp. BIGb0116]|uniref:hypothetical protein n=1 Tax=Sphingobacterium sp. BIGb0116 TaxID=2940619 RepID=UPI002167AAEF|nr:hypothetical protein [Sphingobacterium sp. BIGb0116]MCS4165150.1 hypothetical protein [Sphingobacterium sp. BIGb0116]
MEHEKEISSPGNGPLKRKAKSPSSANRTVYSGYQKAQRCSRGSRTAKTVNSCGNPAFNFIKQTFLPKIGLNGLGKNGKFKITMEMDREFKKSLSLFMEHYNVQFTHSKTGNIAFDWLVDFEKIKDSLGQSDDIILNIIKTELGKVALESKVQYDTGTCLYYIPVVPLFRFLKDKRFLSSRPAVLVLLSACSYLFRFAGVPMYTDQGSYMSYEYDILANWCEEIDESESYRSDLRELKTILSIGEWMHQKFYNEKNLHFLKDRIAKIKPVDEFDRYCLSVGQQTLWLYEHYPNEHIFRFAQDFPENPYGADDVTLMGQYISFIGTADGGIYDMLLDMVNNEFAENRTLQQPEIVKIFDGRPLSNRDFTYENAAFKLLEDVCVILNNY